MPKYTFGNDTLTFDNDADAISYAKEILKFDNDADAVSFVKDNNVQNKIQTQYRQDVANQANKNVEEAKQEHPIINALIPRSLENAVRGDKGVIGNVYDAAKDVLSYPGRSVSRVVMGPESNLEAMREPYPKTAKAVGFVKHVVEDPYTLALMGLGGPMARGIGSMATRLGAKYGPAAVKALAMAGGVGTGAGLNTVIGATERAGDRDSTNKAFDRQKLLTDALIGGAFSAGGEVLGELGKLGVKGSKAWLASRAVKGLPPELQRVIKTEVATKTPSFVSGEGFTKQSLADRLIPGDYNVTPMGAKSQAIENITKRANKSNEMVDEILKNTESSYLRSLTDPSEYVGMTNRPNPKPYIIKDGEPQVISDLSSTGITIDDIISSAKNNVLKDIPKTEYVPKQEIEDITSKLVKNLDNEKYVSPTKSRNAAKYLKAVADKMEPGIERDYTLELASNLESAVIRKVGDQGIVTALLNFGKRDLSPIEMAQFTPTETVANANINNLLKKGLTADINPTENTLLGYGAKALGAGKKAISVATKAGFNPVGAGYDMAKGAGKMIINPNTLALGGSALSALKTPQLRALPSTLAKGVSEPTTDYTIDQFNPRNLTETEWKNINRLLNQKNRTAEENNYLSRLSN